MWGLTQEFQLTVQQERLFQVQVWVEEAFAEVFCGGTDQLLNAKEIKRLH
jgi:galactokinase